MNYQVFPDLPLGGDDTEEIIQLVTALSIKTTIEVLKWLKELKMENVFVVEE